MAGEDQGVSYKCVGIQVDSLIHGSSARSTHLRARGAESALVKNQDRVSTPRFTAY